MAGGTVLNLYARFGAVLPIIKSWSGDAKNFSPFYDRQPGFDYCLFEHDGLLWRGEGSRSPSPLSYQFSPGRVKP
jgi:hypothetical protein